MTGAPHEGSEGQIIYTPGEKVPGVTWIQKPDDRRRVKPEGVGETPDVVPQGGGTFKQKPSVQFVVKLTDNQFDEILNAWVRQCMQDIGKEFRCTLCGWTTAWFKDSKGHFMLEHNALRAIEEFIEQSNKEARLLAREATKKAKLRRVANSVAG